MYTLIELQELAKMDINRRRSKLAMEVGYGPQLDDLMAKIEQSVSELPIKQKKTKE